LIVGLKAAIDYQVSTVLQVSALQFWQFGLTTNRANLRVSLPLLRKRK
jgi:hypothetical protein